MALVTIFLVMFFLLGLFLGPLSMAVLTKLYSEDRGKAFANWLFGLGLKSIWRPAITFNAANELTLKKRSYDEDHDEQKITFGGLGSKVERYLFDPQNRIHDFYGTPFALVDERFGVIFDARDIILGEELDHSQSIGEYTTRVERGGRMLESVLAVFELPRRAVGSRLSNIWTLVGGSFDAQAVKLIHEYYRKGQEPKSGASAWLRLLVPFGVFAGVMLLGMFAAGQSGGGGAAAPAPSGNRTVGIGSSLAILAAFPAVREINWRDLFVSLGIIGAIAGMGAVLYLAFPIPVVLLGIPAPLGIWGLVMFGLGVVITPFIAAFNRGLGPIGGLLGKLYVTIGLLPYDQPVITQTGGKAYELRDYDAEEWPVEPEWYRFAMTRIGVGARPDAWPEDVLESPARVREMGRGPTPDGGVAPTGYEPTNLIKQEDVYGYVPDDVDDDSIYIRTDRTTGWFAEAGQNRRLMQTALEYAKEKYGGGTQPVSDKWILLASMFALVLGAIFDWMVFF